MILFLALLLGMIDAATFAAPKTYDLDKQVTKIEFTAIGKPAFLKIQGVGAKATGSIVLNLKTVNAHIKVHPADFTTGVAQRDQHMKTKYLEVAKYPEADLTITDLTLDKDPQSELFKQKQIPFKGTLTVHGVDSQITGTADIDSTKTSIVVTAKTNTNITAHKIDIPSYLGIKVADQVDILAELTLKK